MVSPLDDRGLVAYANCSGPIDGDGSFEGVETFAFVALLVCRGVETLSDTGPHVVVGYQGLHAFFSALSSLSVVVQHISIFRC